MNKNNLIAILIGCILAWIAMMLLLTCDAQAHDLHLSDVQEQLGPMETGFKWVEDLGYCGCFESGKCFLLYKDHDLHHSGVHAKPLTREQYRKLLELEQENQ